MYKPNLQCAIIRDDNDLLTKQSSGFHTAMGATFLRELCTQAQRSVLVCAVVRPCRAETLHNDNTSSFPLVCPKVSARRVRVVSHDEGFVRIETVFSC